MDAALRPLRQVEARGGPRERGLAIGRALGGEIAGHVAALKGSLPAWVGAPDDHLARLLAETDFKAAIRRHTPDLLIELEATAEGAGVAADDVYVLQLLDEEWAYRVRTSAGRSPEKCSSLAIVGAPTWIAQNMDLGDYTDGFQTLLGIDDGAAPAALVFSAAGMLALMGVNAAGVGVCVNALPQLPSEPEGLPVAFVIRRLLQARSAGEAFELVQSLPHATNQHYLIAGPGQARSFEASAAGVTEYRPPDPAHVLHTNHPLTDAPATPEPPAKRENSVARLEALQARLGAGAVGLAEIEAALSSCDNDRHPIRRTGGPVGFTCGSMISSLAPDRVETWVCAGPPQPGGYHHRMLAHRPAAA